MLEEKINKAIEVIKDTISKAENPFVAFTGGKDSLTTLHLVRSVSKFPTQVLFIDTSAHFKEIYLFVDKMIKLWNLNLVKEKNEEALKTIKIAEDKEQCCRQLKAQALINSIKKYSIDYLFTGIRMDEQEQRQNEEFISPMEDHIRINPLVEFTEKDIWEYIKKNNLPYCSLYDKGYRSIDCALCTKPAEGSDERSGRSQDKEVIMNQLRKLGYL